MKIKLPPKKPVIVTLIVIGALVLAAAPSYYFYSQYQKSQMLLKNPTEAAKQEIQSLVARVGKLIELPSEEPTVATVSDKEKLADQAFFSKAENGDKVLIYTQAKKAILYRPGTNKVIEVAPINLGQTSESSPSATISQEASQVKLVKVAIYNGTATVGLTKTVEKQLKDNLELGPKIEVVAKENAKKQDYAKTIVIDVTGTQKAMTQEIANILSGEVSSLPQGELKPEAAILIILGSDYIK